MAPPESLQDENGQTVFKGHQQVCAQASCVRVAVCVAARCLVLQRVARVAARCCSVCCSALQYGLLYVAELQRVAACCNVLQRVAVCAAVRCRVAARCERADCD